MSKNIIYVIDTKPSITWTQSRGCDDTLNSPVFCKVNEWLKEKIHHLILMCQMWDPTEPLHLRSCDIFLIYPVSIACCTPACVVVESLSGAPHLLTRASCRVSLAQTHLCLQSTGGAHIPAQPCAALPQLHLHHGHGHIVLHSFKYLWKERLMNRQNKNIAVLWGYTIICYANVCRSEVDLLHLVGFWTDRILFEVLFPSATPENNSFYLWYYFETKKIIICCYLLFITINMWATWKHRHDATKFEDITISLLPLGCKGWTHMYRHHQYWYSTDRLIWLHRVDNSSPTDPCKNLSGYFIPHHLIHEIVSSGFSVFQLDEDQVVPVISLSSESGSWDRDMSAIMNYDWAVQVSHYTQMYNCFHSQNALCRLLSVRTIHAR